MFFFKLVSRQPKKFRKILTKVKFEENPLPLLLKKLFFSPAVTVFITDVDISSCETLFNLRQTISPWYAIYILMCNTCEWFYLGQTTNLKQRIRKHKSDVFHSQNSFGKKCSEHLRDCSRMKESFFRKPQLNTYQ